MSDPAKTLTPNALPRLASVGGVLIGLFLLLGAYGHFAAVWSVVNGSTNASGFSRFDLMVPGLVLVLTGLLNIGICRLLWTGTTWSLNPALICNVATALYLAYLLATGVEGHPIGHFLALVSSYVLLLGAIRAGLVWPVTDSAAG